MVFNQRDYFGDVAEHLLGGMSAGDPNVVVPNPLAIVERFGRPERRAPDFSHLPGLLPKKIVDAGLASQC
jgi:hypothetical protein